MNATQPILELTIVDDGCRKEDVWYYPHPYSVYKLSVLTDPALFEEGELDMAFIRGVVKYNDIDGKSRVVLIYEARHRGVIRHVGSDCRGGSFDRAWFVRGRSATPLEIKREVAAEVEKNGAGLCGKFEGDPRFSIVSSALRWLGVFPSSAF